jgi:hypothetical protein
MGANVTAGVDGRGVSLAHTRPPFLSLISAALKPLYYHEATTLIAANKPQVKKKYM